MYPPNFNLYRFSRGIKKPIVSYMDYFDAKIKVGFCKQPTFKQCSSVEDLKNGFKNIYVYEYYNKLRWFNQLLGGSFQFGDWVKYFSFAHNSLRLVWPTSLFLRSSSSGKF